VSVEKKIFKNRSTSAPVMTESWNKTFTCYAMGFWRRP